MARGIFIYKEFLAMPKEKQIAFLEYSQEAAVILSHVAEKLKTQPENIIHELRNVIKENTKLKNKLKGK